MKITTVTVLVALGLGMATQAAADNFRPAEVGPDTVDYLQAAVQVPELTDQTPVAAVYCQADVGNDGLTRNVSCYQRSDFERLRRQVEEAMAGREFTPAEVDGEVVPVRMVFRVIYADRSGQPPIMVLPNLGHMQGEFGYQYSAPQERLDENNWYALYRRDPGSEGQPFFGRNGEMTRVHAWVNDSGRVVAANSLESHGDHRRDARNVEKALEVSRFLPGMVDGKAERMRYIAVLHYPG